MGIHCVLTVFNGYGFESYLVDDDLNHHEVEDGASEDHPPEYWVRPREGTVGKGQNGDDHEVDEHATQASPNIPTEVARVPETKIKKYRHVPVTLKKIQPVPLMYCLSRRFFHVTASVFC